MHLVNGASTSNGHVVQSPQDLRKEELIRLMIQELRCLGYKNVAHQLETESGYQLEPSSISEFRESILSGKWDRAEELLEAIDVSEDSVKMIQFLIKEQKYLEFLEDRHIKKALVVLRNELTPLNYNLERLHKLSSYMMCATPDDLRKVANWDGAQGSSRKTLMKSLQKYIPSSVMIPEKRLETLIDQALIHQKRSCLYHNTPDDDISLYSDSTCDKSNFPTANFHIFDGHSDEVWYVTFSHNGRHLASASKDCSCIIWDIKTKLALHVLTGHKNAVSFLSWSPDDRLLLSCGNDQVLKLWDTATGACVMSLTRHTEAVTACGWTADGQRFVSGGLDKSMILWDMEGNVVHKWTGARITDLATSKDGTKLVAICHEKKIRIFDLHTFALLGYIQESDSITSIALSDDGRYAIANLSSQKIHLWDLEEKRLVQQYIGQKQGRFVIRSVFGGYGQAFIASGSEDCNLYIWHREQGKLIETLSGHTDTVNGVTWNPADPSLVATASDDGTIRL
ncbi:WD40-repeat-containing domain protein [Paraphysoderma sedebokerense]|nr:WD40-repeat-containing domain protein [Paraphysoderma sedebokerense]